MQVLPQVIIRHSKKVLALPPKHVEDVPVFLRPSERQRYLDVHKSAKEQYQRVKELGEGAVNSNVLALMALLNPMRRICSGGVLSGQELAVADLSVRLQQQAERRAAIAALQASKATEAMLEGGEDGGELICPEEIAEECKSGVLGRLGLSCLSSSFFLSGAR